MKVEEVCQGLELFLSKDKNERLRERIARFGEDSRFLDYFERLARKNMRDVRVEDLIPIVAILDTVVFPDYPVENPVLYSGLYKNAINGNKLGLFRNLLGHLNRVSGIEKTIASFGIDKNPNLGKEVSGNTDTRPYVFSESSYLLFMRALLDNNKNETIGEFDKQLGDLETHLGSLKQQNFDIKRLIENGYCTLLRNIYTNEKKVGTDKFAEISERLAKLFKRLDSAGFDMYHRSNIALASKWLEGDKLSQVEFLTEYVSKEALMYVSRLHFKNE